MMGHLGSEQLVDLLDGVASPDAASHLDACAACRRQLEDLRDAMAAAADLTVPEPSPLFWHHLSARVRASVEREPGPGPAWWRAASRPRLAVSVLSAAAAVLLLLVVFAPRGGAPGETAPEAVAAAPAPDVAPAMVVDDDPLLDVVADLASQMDWEEAIQVELAVHQGAVEEAFGDLSEAERREMRQLLTELQ